MGLALSNPEQAMLNSYLAASKEHMGKVHTGDRSTRVLMDYGASLTRMEQLQAAAANGGLLANAELFQDNTAPWKHVAAALSEGLSQVALVQPNLYWDTHSYNSEQGNAYNEFFGGLNQLLAELHAKKILDQTTVLVVSEMGRTPKANATQGKDHWPWTSAMLVGGGLKGNRVVGQTDEWLRPKKVDLATGQLNENGVLLHAGHVLATAQKALGLSAETWFEQGAIDGVVA